MAIAFSLSVVAVTASAGEFKYVGAKKCKTCHKKELIGNQYAKWQESGHSKAFDTLKSDKALEIAKEKGIAGAPHESDDCLKCHATAFGLTPEQIAKKPLKLTDGIQCETCHGPGSAYKKKKVMSDHDKSVAAGMLEPDEKTCTGCHNDESPTWDAAKGFDFEERKERLRTPSPKTSKASISKSRRPERRPAAGETTKKRTRTNRALGSTHREPSKERFEGSRFVHQRPSVSACPPAPRDRSGGLSRSLRFGPSVDGLDFEQARRRFLDVVNQAQPL